MIENNVSTFDNALFPNGVCSDKNQKLHKNLDLTHPTTINTLATFSCLPPISPLVDFIQASTEVVLLMMGCPETSLRASSAQAEITRGWGGKVYYNKMR